MATDAVDEVPRPPPGIMPEQPLAHLYPPFHEPPVYQSVTTFDRRVWHYTMVLRIPPGSWSRVKAW